MKKAVKITNRVFILGLLFIVVLYGVMAVSEQMGSAEPLTPLEMLERPSGQFKTLFLKYGLLFVAVSYTVVRLLLFGTNLILKQVKRNPAA